MNLFMCVPLRDQVGSVKYFLGAQLDITGIVKDCTALESLHKVFNTQKPRKGQMLNGQSSKKPTEEKDQFKELCELFNEQELEELKEMEERKQRRRYNPDAVEEHRKRPPLSKGVTSNFTKDTLLRGQSVGRTVGFYENVGFPYVFIMTWLKLTVSPRPACTVPPDSLCFAFSTITWDFAIALHAKNWRQRKSSH